MKSLGEYINEKSFQILSEAIEKPNTFNDIVPASAIAGLSKYSNALEKIKSNEVNEDEKLHLKLLFKKAIEILIKKTQKWNSNNIRTSAVGGLKPFLLNDDKEIRKDIFKALIDSLDDSWLDVRKGALAILEVYIFSR